MPKVTVLLDGNRRTVQASLVFPSQNPATGAHNVNFRYTHAGRRRYVQLFCQSREEAETLSAAIREGRVTDLTAYPAERR